jgi:hypothetical protein
VPNVLLGEVRGNRRLVHPVVVAQLPAGEVETPVLATYTVAVVVVVVVDVVGATVKSTALSG